MASYLPQVKKKMNTIKAIGDAKAVLQTRGHTYAQLHDEIDILIK